MKKKIVIIGASALCAILAVGAITVSTIRSNSLVSVPAMQDHSVKLQQISAEASLALEEGHSLSIYAAVDTALEMVEGTVVKAGLDPEFSRVLYEIEIVDVEGYTHDLAIDADTGEAVRERDDEKLYSYQQYLDVAVDWKTAVAAALSSLEGSVLDEFEMERSSGTLYYDVEVFDEAGVEHKVRVNADTAEVMTIRRDMDIPADYSAAFSMEQAKEAAENAIEGGIILLLKLEKEDKATVYDIKAVSDQGTLYELKIDAATGSVLEQEWED